VLAWYAAARVAWAGLEPAGFDRRRIIHEVHRSTGRDAYGSAGQVGSLPAKMSRIGASLKMRPVLRWRAATPVLAAPPNC